MRTRYFHEDECCQQELLPLGAWDHCAAQVKEIAAFSDAHFDGVAWTDIYLRKDPSTTLKELLLKEAELATALPAVFPPFDNVTTGYSSHIEPCPDVKAYGTDEGITIFLQRDAGGFVGAMWIDPWGITPADIESVCNALSTLPRASELLFVDWAWGRMFWVSDREAWFSYLQDHFPKTGE